MAAGVAIRKPFMTTSALVLLFSLCHLPRLASSVSFNYTTFSDATQNISVQGNASFGAGWIELSTSSSSPRRHSMGRAAYSQPVQLRDSATGEVASFTTRFSFSIDPKDPGNKGDGMAFFLASYPSRMPDTSDGGALGLTSQNIGTVLPGDNRFVAVEFDTFNNSFDPSNTYDHIGIDVNSVRSVTNLSLPNFSLIGNMTAVIEYASASSVLSVKLWLGDGSGQNYSLSSKVDLRSALPEQVAVGFSAATGASIELHQLRSWYFNSSFERKAVPRCHPRRRRHHHHHPRAPQVPDVTELLREPPLAQLCSSCSSPWQLSSYVVGTRKRQRRRRTWARKTMMASRSWRLRWGRGRGGSRTTSSSTRRGALRRRRSSAKAECCAT